MPEKLADLFRCANTALFELHREMDISLDTLPGCDLWRSVYAMRVKLNQTIQPMTENNFKAADQAIERSVEDDATRVY